MPQVNRQALVEPLPYLRDKIEASGLSSLELSRATGVPGSTIRSISGGVTTGISHTVWLTLVRHFKGVKL